MAYAPTAIQACYDTIAAQTPSAQLSGIYADKYGYHNSRNQLPPTDYSVQKPYDKEGDGDAASGIDITLSDADIKKFTQRLIDETLAHGDSGRLRALREFFGTTNGHDVTGMDVPGGYFVTSDDSHLWHNHLSGKRKYANDHAAWQDVAAVMLGTAGTGEDDMPTYLSIGHTKAQTFKAKQWAWLLFDKVYSDPDDTVTPGKAGIHHVEGRHMVITVSANCEAATDEALSGTIRTKFTQLKSVADAPDPIDTETRPLEHPVTSGATGVADTRTLFVQDGNYLVVGFYADADMSIKSAGVTALYW